MDKENIYKQLYVLSTHVDDMALISKDRVDRFMRLNSLSLADLDEILVKSTNNNVYFKLDILEKYKPFDYAKYIYEVKDEVFKNIPSFLKIIVDSIPLSPVTANFDFNYDTNNNKILFDEDYIKGKVINDLTHTLGCLYWEAFCYLIELNEFELKEEVGDIASGKLKVPDMEPFHKRHLFKKLEREAKQNKFNVMVKTTDPNDVVSLAHLMKFLFETENNCKQ